MKKLCKDCVYCAEFYHHYNSSDVHLCYKDACISYTDHEDDLVIGPQHRIVDSPTYCYSARSDENGCGVEGKFWKPNLKFRVKAFLRMV